MAGMTVDGLISGLDTTSLITQLLQAEAAPQTALKKRLSAGELAASAYRTVNTSFAAVRAAAEALTSGGVTGGRKATSTDTSVTATATASAVAGTSLTFTTTALAATHTVLSNSEWTSTTADVRTQEPGWPIEILEADGTTVRGTIDVPAGATLQQAVTAINGAGLGVTATIVTLGTGRHRLQLTGSTSGADGTFIVKSATEDQFTAGSGFLVTRQGQDATLDLGGGVRATSKTNTFADLMPGVSVTVAKVDENLATVTVGNDHDAAATKMKTLVDAVNAAIGTVKTYTSNAPGSTAALKGDSSVTRLASQLLDAVAFAVGSDGSPAQIGLQLSRSGEVTFDPAAFTAALSASPELAERLIGGTAADAGPDGTLGTADDVAAVTGIAGRLLAVAVAASDSTTGTLTTLAKGKDSLTADIKARIADWDLRLEQRREMLTRQFSAMETALSSLKNQSTWLAGQLNSLSSSSG